MPVIRGTLPSEDKEVSWFSRMARELADLGTSLTTEHVTLALEARGGEKASATAL